MILRSLVRRHNAWSKHIPAAYPQTPAFSTPQSRQIRNAHSIPSFGDPDSDHQLRTQGIPGFLSPGAFDIAWTQYQEFLLGRLNTILANDPGRAQWKLKDLIINTAREPNLAPTFNYASMAHNNHFYFSALSRGETEIPPQLERFIKGSFGSLDTLKETLLATASAMFGPGFVWLVQEENPSLGHPATANSSSQSAGQDLNKVHFRLVTTYLAGSPYPGAHTRQQSLDMNSQNMQSTEDYYRQTRVQNAAGSFGRASAGAKGMASIGMDPAQIEEGGDTRRFGGADCIPVLCVNTWQHCYLHDYGVAGKREYLANWWNRVDWPKVWSNCVLRQNYSFIT